MEIHLSRATNDVAMQQSFHHSGVDNRIMAVTSHVHTTPAVSRNKLFFPPPFDNFYYLDRKFKRTMHGLRLISSNSKLNQQTTRSSQRKKSNQLVPRWNERVHRER